MKPIVAVLVFQVLLYSYTASAVNAPALDVIKNVRRLEFRTCPGCRLNYQPELKRYLYEEVKSGSIDGVTVNFITGHRPELILLDAEDKQIGGVSVDHVTLPDIKLLLEELGF